MFLTVQISLVYLTHILKVIALRFIIGKRYDKVLALFLNLYVKEVHLRSTYKTCNELVFGVVEEIGRSVNLLYYSKLHYDYSRTHCHCLDLVVGYVNESSL